MKTIEEESTDVICSRTIHTSKQNSWNIKKLGGESSAAVVVTNNQIDTMLIKQLSDVDTVALEIISGSSKIILVSMYFDREKPIELEMSKIEAAMHHAKGAGIHG
jgi:hypothetical protein